jgi:folate-binding protein YgfZ
MSFATIHESPEVARKEDLRAEFASLVSGCGVFELVNRSKISLSGKDRERWLNGMISNKIRGLPVGRGVYAFVLNPQGHILADLYAFNRGESLLIDADQSQAEKLLGIFRKYIIMDKVEVASDTLAAIAVTGPKAGSVLRAAGFDSQPSEPLQFLDVTWRGLPLSIVRSDNGAAESYEIWVAPEQVAMLVAALTKSGAVPVNTAAWELLRIACGIPRYGQDIHERDLPQETEQLRALNFDKGCYIGQEIVERIRSRGAVHRMFTGFEVQGPPPAAGTKIQSDAKDVGEITTAAVLPLASGKRAVALGYIRRENATPGRHLHAGEAGLTPASLPFAGVFQK